ncbi:MAG: Fic family protein [Nitrospirae bacterium]|nr:Fic family protein [Nitrospirota bacterium]MBF0536500.1 Fic family protein [Nitrospirota bacterium]MBF0618390.1 Fic family protein [Nitrospirota bacterium]
MPHRAGYFVLAYQWDHHCQKLYDSLMGRINQMLRELHELEHDNPDDLTQILYYYKKWHYNKDLYNHTFGEIEKRQFVINSLGYRGYGVNIDLLNALGALKKDYAGHIAWLLSERFNKLIPHLRTLITLEDKQVQDMDSGYVIDEICKRLNWNTQENTPAAAYPILLELSSYFKIMSEETPWNVNTAIFQKLFLHLGTSSMTIMKGTVGHTDQLSAAELKVIANRNFRVMYRETFSNLHTFTELGIDFLKQIHLNLSKGLVPNAGEFRAFDFPDKNGVTYECENFNKEIKSLGYVLWETSQSFHNLDAFVYDLCRSYYMFIGIHPFGDSNGRVGKCFLNYMLLKKGLPPVSFDDDDEVLALPRYGGSMEDIYNYIKKRILVAIDAYYYERWKIEHLGNINKQIYNVAFDSGFYFWQIDDKVQKLEVHFFAFVVGSGDPLFGRLQDQCRVVFSDELMLNNMSIHCGFTKIENAPWEHTFSLKGNFFIKEVEMDIKGARTFDIDFTIELLKHHYDYNYFNISVSSADGGLIHNNKGLNYTYKIQR